MSRKPTGRPRGRQLGSGTLGLGTQDAHERLTLRIPSDLYKRLEAFAEGRAYTRGTPLLARCVRDAIEHYLACPNRRQTSNIPLPVHTWQTSNATQEAEENIRQTSNSVEDNIRQTHNVPREALGTREHDTGQTVNVLEDTTAEQEHDNWQTSKTAHPVPLAAADLAASPVAPVGITPGYDATKHVLGDLCKHAHDYQSTGQSLRRLADHECLECQRLRAQAARQRKRQAAQ